MIYWRGQVFDCEPIFFNPITSCRFKPQGAAPGQHAKVALAPMSAFVVAIGGKADMG